MEEHELMPAYPAESDQWMSEHKDDSRQMNTKTAGKKHMQNSLIRRGKLPRRAVIYSE